LVRIAGERERLASKERSLVEAEKYLAAALEASGIEMSPVEEIKAPPPPPASEPRAPKPPTVAPSPPPVRVADPYREDIFEEEGRDAPEAKAKISRADALERMTRALETAKRARDQGRNVSEIRKALKQARAAFESGDYETASRLAEEILRELEAIALTR
jgi:predicted lipid-binding transport protein (Tim44 family)